MSDRIGELARAFERFPGIGPRQAKRFVYHLLSVSGADRAKLSELIAKIGSDVHQCPECMRFSNGNGPLCAYCADPARDDALLTLVEKDQDLAALERAGTYRGRYFVLGGVLTLSGKGAIRERDLIRVVGMRLGRGLKEIVLALSATSEGEHTSDRIRELLAPYRERVRISTLGRGLATGSELEYSDAETLRAALAGRKET
ncbi:MAG: toprim domain-containing protein [Patescibacteria group bacterium]|nr:toprim domain-containing protein [Patescibacteria group bacterium]MDE1965700.1 toprim domain-containing protein [Patescibacteria group bacterium]